MGSRVHSHAARLCPAFWAARVQRKASTAGLDQQFSLRRVLRGISFNSHGSRSCSFSTGISESWQVRKSPEAYPCLVW